MKPFRKSPVRRAFLWPKLPAKYTYRLYNLAMSISTLLSSLFRPRSNGNRPPAPRMAKKNLVSLHPPFNLIGVASANGEAISSTLAFVMHEVYGWKVATLNTRYFVQKGVVAMLGLSPNSVEADPVIGVSAGEAAGVVETALEASFPGIWLRCLDYAASRLPAHILVVHGIEQAEQAEWVRSRGGKIIGDGTVYGIAPDIPVFPDAENSFVSAAMKIVDDLTTAQEQ